MFFKPDVLIKQKQFRINLMRQRDEVGNAHLIAALEREIRALQEKENEGV